MASAKRQYHLQCSPGRVGRYVLLPGDPGRCETIAAALEGAHLVAQNREFTTWTGALVGVPVSVTSTGIGGPSAAIAVEELCNLGAHTLIRVGSCGGMQPKVRLGDLVIAQAAARDEGTTGQYVPSEFPAVAHLDVTLALREAAREAHRRAHVGTVQSKDSFYGEMEPSRMPVGVTLQQRWEAFIRAGVLASEMECASVFIAGGLRGARCGAVLAVVNETPLRSPMPDVASLRFDPVIQVALGALRQLIAGDMSPR